jgi:hypothetical protein
MRREGLDFCTGPAVVKPWTGRALPSRFIVLGSPMAGPFVSIFPFGKRFREVSPRGSTPRPHLEATVSAGYLAMLDGRRFSATNTRSWTPALFHPNVIGSVNGLVSSSSALSNGGDEKFTGEAARRSSSAVSFGLRIESIDVLRDRIDHIREPYESLSGTAAQRCRDQINRTVPLWAIAPIDGAPAAADHGIWSTNRASFATCRSRGCHRDAFPHRRGAISAYSRSIA